MHELVLDVREALSIWLALIALTALVCVIISLTSRQGRVRRAERRAVRARRTEMRRNRQALARAGVDPGPAPGRAVKAGRPTLPGTVNAVADDQPVDSPADLSRYAEEVAVAAARAAVTADRRRQEWHAVLNAQEAAWRAYEAADHAARRAMRAAVFPLPDTALTEEETDRRERYLLRAATGAYHRGELTIEQLSAAMMHRGGWDPKRHPFEQDLIIRVTGRARLLRTYQEVSEIERTAWRQAEMAAAAQRSLHEEAFAAAMRAHEAQHPELAAARRQRADVQATQVLALRPPAVARGRVAVS